LEAHVEQKKRKMKNSKILGPERGGVPLNLPGKVDDLEKFLMLYTNLKLKF